MEFVKGLGGVYYLLIVLAAAVAIECALPWRKGLKINLARWLRNASMTVYGTILLSAIPAIAAFGAATAAEANGVGLMNQLGLPFSARLIISVLALDLMAYGQHRMLHQWYVLWRTHRAHHTDINIDVSTSLRFHPFETLFRAMIEVAVVFALGVPPEGILLIYLIHVIANAFTHANVALPRKADIILSRIITTPAVHRQHHSTDLSRQCSNFGTAFTIWDQMFGTFSGPENLREDERFGVEGPEAMKADTFGNLVFDPFRKPKGAGVPRPPAPDMPAAKDAAADKAL
ncbi:sterol desaturase family protein [Hyphococcus luteus]|uniref:Sterol desaturase n=1 Tax=Hyphococcus luteus TaxID=2058213 RepID=A0A2S7K7M9_9PROT|nr:sterol desaturase family protein [Marinicaulis flavus]PQA88492.1 sterol desaturase [Marinicaulis flavus]